MLLEPHNLELFFRLHKVLMFFVNERLGVLPEKPATPEDFAAISPQLQIKVRDAWLADRELLDQFVAENPARLPDDELDIVRSWRHCVKGTFYIFRELTNYTVFLASNEQSVAYGVLALATPFEDLIGPRLPVMVQAVLLPFQGKIVYDGLMTSYRITFGAGIRRSLNESFKEAKLRYGIVTSLPISDTPKPPPKAPKAKPRPKVNAKEQTNAALAAILELTDQFCEKHLTAEYAALCRKLAEKLSRKRPSPLLRGSPYTWASGIVRTVGWVNFLHDKSQSLHMQLCDIDAEFGISESTGAAKLAAIRKMLRIHHFEPEWTLPSRQHDNPMVQMQDFNRLLKTLFNR